MGWGQRWPRREPRPTAAKLDAAKVQAIQKRIQGQLALSPVLVQLGIESKVKRGRFYLESGQELLGRITPLEGDRIVYLLESPHGNSWTEKGRGTPEKLMKLVANDDSGTFHGLGALGRALSERGPEAQLDSDFRYSDGAQAGAQEALFYGLGVPIDVLAEPREWYLLHRSPHIVEFDTQERRALVRFVAHSWSGESFGGTCLYLVLDNQWRWFTVRPSQSEDIKTAVAWLQKRKWVGWR